MGGSSLTIFFILFILLTVFIGGLRLAIFILFVSPIIFKIHHYHHLRAIPESFHAHKCIILLYECQVPDGLVNESGVPLNKGNIYIAQTSPDSVYKAYFDLFEKDFTLYLRSRSEEIIPGGHMVLIMIVSDMKASNSSHKYRWFILELLGITLNDMVLEVHHSKNQYCHFPFLPNFAS